MRPFFLAALSVAALSLFLGCAAGQRAEAGTAPWPLPDSTESVRVRILLTKRPVRLEATGPFQFQARKGGKIFSEKSSIRVRAVSHTLSFGGRNFKADVVAKPLGAADYLKLNGRRYRGTLVFHPLGGGRYDVVEYVGLQEYLYGVLPREVETDWPLDALKAQAVVSRTYALSNKSGDASSRFDLSDGVFDQVYGGLEVESPLSNRAVDDTRGQVLVNSAGRPIEAFFHSSCGGWTELPQRVWKSPGTDDVFACVPDAFCREDPHYSWRVEMSLSSMVKRLRRIGVRVSSLKKISIVKKSPSGRAEIIALHTSGGVVEVSGNRFRLAMGADSLRSTLFTNLKQTKKSVLIEGHGWGHGVGLCQWGARGRAAAGQTYKQILEVYYPKAILRQT